MALKRPPKIRYQKNAQPPKAERMSKLAESFRSLTGKTGVRPWAPAKLDTYGQSASVTDGELHSIRFVLHVWNHSTRWGCGAFNLGLALKSWGEREREVFARWAGEPWLG